MAFHQIEPIRETLHGRFSPALPPVLTIDSGDTVRYRTLDAGWGLAPPNLDWTPRQKFGPRLDPRDDGHAMCGPVPSSWPALTTRTPSCFQAGSLLWLCG